MGLYDAKSSLKGQVTVPAEVRKLLGLQPGGQIQFRSLPDGTVEIRAKKRSIKNLKGLFGRPSAPVDVSRAIGDEVLRRNKPDRDA